MSRRCNACGEHKPPEEFHACKRDPALGLQWQCIACNSARNKATYQRIRNEILDVLGGCCACCGESERVFLQVDHVDGGGGAERKKGMSPHALLRRVTSAPKDFQILCGNCHAAKTSGVTCPHQQKAGEMIWEPVKA